MKIKTTTVLKVQINHLKSLDPITAIFEDIEEGKGKVIIECFGKSWASYWGAMGGRKITRFFQSEHCEYIAGCCFHGQEAVPDVEALQQRVQREIIKQRRAWDISWSKARVDYELSKGLKDFSECQHSPLFSKYIGDEWFLDIPMKENHEFTYLKKIILNVQAALNILEQGESNG